MHSKLFNMAKVKVQACAIVINLGLLVCHSVDEHGRRAQRRADKAVSAFSAALWCVWLPPAFPRMSTASKTA